MTGSTTTMTTTTQAGSFIKADRLRLTSHPTLNESWLRERIVDDPSVLGLGDLRLADEGRLRDGRLELLLRDPATGRRFTVLVRVGPAEEADLVRVLEQWTVESARYPEHPHFAVVIAEELPPRVLSAANTLGGTIPISAMQVSALSVGEHVALYFNVVVDRLPPRTTPAVAEQVNGNGSHGTNGAGRKNGHAKPEGTATLPAPARMEEESGLILEPTTIGVSNDAAAPAEPTPVTIEAPTPPAPIAVAAPSPTAEPPPPLNPAPAAATSTAAQPASPPTAAAETQDLPETAAASVTSTAPVATDAPQATSPNTLPPPATASPVSETPAPAYAQASPAPLPATAPAASPASTTRVWEDPADARPAVERPRERAPHGAPRQPATYTAPVPTGNGRVFSFLCIISLLLCAATSFAWVRSYWAKDVLTFPDAAGREHVVISDRGHVDWIAPATSPAGIERYVKVPFWLPVGLTAILPIAWLIRRRSRGQDA